MIPILDSPRRLALAASLALSTFLSAQEQPNVLIIMADDWGFGSAGCYGASEEMIQTPAIDRIASEGVRFLDANTPSSVCSPTRYALLTGRYPWRTRMKKGVINMNDPLLLDPVRPSLGKWFRSSGYRTAMIGKWHLGYGSENKKSSLDWTTEKGMVPGPLELGFDYHFGVPQNHGDGTGVYVENRAIWGLESSKVFPFSKCYYGSPFYGFDAPQRVNKDVMGDLTDRAVNWMKKSADKPFFLYYAPVAVHHPITPSDEKRGESGCGPYGDFLLDLDWSVERLLKALDELGQADNTLVILTSDNGGDIPGGDHNKHRPERTAEKLGLKINGPYRGDKHTIWQGGVKVPFLVRWPERFKGGATSKAMINVVDVFATLHELLAEGSPAPARMSSDSCSFASALKDPAVRPPRKEPMITTDVAGMYAIRQGPWKLIEGTLAKNKEGKALYHLSTDVAERKNVLAENPTVAAELQGILNRIRRPDQER